MIAVVKVGSSSVSTDTVVRLCDEIAPARHAGHTVVVVTSGAISAGWEALDPGTPRPTDPAVLQAVSAVGQHRLMRLWQDGLDRDHTLAGQVLLAPLDFVHRTQYLHARGTLRHLIDLGVVPVVNENDAVADEEIRFGDNDRLAALVAHVVRAGALVLLSDVDGLYDFDPRYPGAQRITHVGPDQAELDGITLGPPSRAGAQGGAARGVGTGGMVTKVDAALIATEAGIPAVVAGAGQAVAALAGEPVGTYFAPHGRRPATRQLWLAHAAVARGTLALDAGDPVDLCDPEGHVVARGLVNYDAAEIPALMGRSTRWLAARKGAEYEREVVHRDDLVVLAPMPLP